MLNYKQPMQISLPSPGGVKTIKFKFPDDELIERRQKARGYSVKGNSETVHECPSLDMEIMSEMFIDGDQLEQSEVTNLLNRLTSAEVTDGGRCDGGFFVQMKHLNAEFRHELRIPSADQMQKYRRESMKSTSTRYGGTTYTTHLKPGRELFDALWIKSEGYPEDFIPITHKAMAVSELSILIESEVQISNPPQSPATKP